MKKCKECKKEKELSEFPRLKDVYRKTREQYRPLCKDCFNERQRNYAEKRRHTNQKFMIEYLLKNPCKTCGEGDIRVLEFNHLTNKKHNISNMVNTGYSLSKIKQEVNKCEVLCANCHKKYTDKQNNSYKHRYYNG